jgi:predicted DNA-binding transcriptional regulator YafY
MKREKITHERRHIRKRLEILDRILNSEKHNYKSLLQKVNSQLASIGEIPISDRTLKYDVSFLENNENAPIHRPKKGDDRVYYFAQFSIKKGVIDEDEVSLLKGAIAILKKVGSMKLTEEVEEIISRLENKISTNIPEGNTLIAFEEHTAALGTEYFDALFSAIQEKSPIKFIYQPFGKPEREWIVHPYMLKQFRNRWFLIGRIGNNLYLSTFRLDSIKSKIKNSGEPFIENDLFEPETHFNNVIGVTIPKNQELQEIHIKVKAASADYIRTKPIHKSQEIIKSYVNGDLLITLKVYNNYELISTLMSYGPSLYVKQPKEIREELKNWYYEGFRLYK